MRADDARTGSPTSTGSATTTGRPIRAGASADAGLAITVVWCDFGGVLTPPIEEAIGSVVEATGVPWGALSAAADAVAGDLGLTGLQPLELGLLTQREWGARVTDRLAAEQRPRVPLTEWGDYWYRGRAPQTALLHALAEARSRGIRIGLLTNSVREWEPLRRDLLGELRLDAAVRSHEIGIAKPHPRIFAHADAVLPPETGCSVLIDDLEANCVAAEEHGWRAIHHRDPVITVAELQRMVALG